MRLVPEKTKLLVWIPKGKELDLKISNLSCLIKVDGNVINFSTEAEHIGVTRTTTGGNLHHIVSRLTAHSGHGFLPPLWCME